MPQNNQCCVFFTFLVIDWRFHKMTFILAIENSVKECADYQFNPSSKQLFC